MRQDTRFALLATVCTVLTGCGGGREPTNDASMVAEEKVLHVYNWADYIAPCQ
jgi:spermidine/putrescine-binding protein